VQGCVALTALEIDAALLLPGSVAAYVIGTQDFDAADVAVPGCIVKR